MEIAFWILAVISISGAALAVVLRNLVHAVLSLVLFFFGIAGLFFLLRAEFLGAVQILIYVGAVGILFLFAIMLTRRVAQDTSPPLNGTWFWALMIAVVLFGGIVWISSLWPDYRSIAPEMSKNVEPLRQLGQALVSPNAYAIPFEVASVLLLAALIGSIIVAWEKRLGRR